MFGKKRNKEDVAEAEAAADVEESGRDESEAAGAEEQSAGAAEAAGEASSEAASDENEDWKGRYLRSLADQENFRKRMERERELSRKYAAEGLMTDLLGVLDALQAASDAEGELDAIREGIGLARQELLRILSDKGLVPIEAQGQPFDPRLHEAMCMVPTADAQPGTIVNEISRGYTLHDRVLRASRVQVAAAPPKPAEPDEETDEQPGEQA